MKKTIAMLLLLVGSRAVPAPAAGMAGQWDRDQTRWLRDMVFPRLARMPNWQIIQGTFERALLGDTAAVPSLIALASNPDDDVASGAIKLLGRFTDAAASAALKDALANHPNARMRAGALASLGRMRDPEAATLAVAALTHPDDLMKGAGGMALGLIGDSSNAPAILGYLDQMVTTRGVLDTGTFGVLAELGDPPGSTAVRDRLLAEANRKTNEFDDRMEAAYALRKMGLEHLVARLFDRANAEDTVNSLITLKDLIADVAAARRIVLRDQTSVDGVLAQIDDPNVRNDAWGRPLRAKFVSPGVFHVVSDGPDQAPNTADDMSTAEPFATYDQRVFGDLF